MPDTAVSVNSRLRTRLDSVNNHNIVVPARAVASSQLCVNPVGLDRSGHLLFNERLDARERRLEQVNRPSLVFGGYAAPGEGEVARSELLRTPGPHDDPARLT